jgi:hypothetical protein
MSLIGSLEDLGLGDILQIISLSQKSGVLSIRGDDGEGCIILLDGLVRGASLKGGPTDLRGVLVDGSFLEAEEYDEATERARREGITIEEALSTSTSLTAERIDSLRRECVEAAVMAMFAWQSGEFSFDVRSEPDSEDPPLFLRQGINAQYLAMEGTRIGDESAHIRSEWRDETGADLPDDLPEMSAEEMFGVDAAEALSVGPGIGDPRPVEHDLAEDTFPDDGPPGAVEALGLAVAERVDDAENADPEADAVVADAEIEADSEDADEGFAFAEPVEPPEGTPGAEPRALAEAPVALEPAVVESVAEEPPPVSAPIAAPLPNAPLVVIDPDLVALEWIKQTLKDSFPRIHIFQRWDLGLSPIRQYLARATRPVVLLCPDAHGDPLSGIRNGQDFVSRLKAQQPRLPILWLQEAGGSKVANAGPADGVLTRPGSAQLRDPKAADKLEHTAAGLREGLATVLARDVETDMNSRRQGSTPVPDSLRQLKAATAALAEASTRGEVLPLVIRFAAEVFDRVAMFMVRGDTVVGMAQSGLPAAGGPDDEVLRTVEVSHQGSAWFRAVLESRKPVRAAPSDGGDYTLAALLGQSASQESYIAPLESGGEIVALLYADNLPNRRPLGDTQALEVVLQHAGLALDRAVLERALAEAEGASEGRAPGG